MLNLILNECRAELTACAQNLRFIELAASALAKKSELSAGLVDERRILLLTDERAVLIQPVGKPAQGLFVSVSVIEVIGCFSEEN